MSPFAQALEAIGAILALWRPRLGLAVVLVPLVLTLLLGNMESDLIAMLVVTGAFAAMAPPLEAVAVGALFLGYAVVRGLQSPPWWEMAASYLIFFIPGVLAGVGLRALSTARRRGQSRVEVMEEDTSRIRGEERARLAEELRSLVTVGLTRSRAVLDEVNDAAGPERLRSAIAEVNDACLAALIEVRALVGMLREDPTGEGADESIAGPRVSEVVRRSEKELLAAGVPFTLDVPEGLDQLGQVTQSTLVRVIEEAVGATIAEQRASEEGIEQGLAIAAERRRGRVIVEAGYPAPPVPEPEQRRRIDRLRQRVEAMGGTLSIAREGDTNRLRLDLLLAHDGAGHRLTAGEGHGVRAWFTSGTLSGVLTMAITLGVLAAGAQLPGALLAGEMPWELVWETAGFAVALLLLWWPKAGVVPAAVVTLGMLLTPHADDLALAGLLLVACVQAARVRSRSAAAWLGAVVSVIMLLAALVGTGAVRERAVAAAIVLLALPSLIAARHFVAARRRQFAQMVSLEATAEGIRVEERNLLARELHDVLAHHLSVATLQSMAYGDSDDPVELRTALDRMRRSTVGAQQEMELLSRIMSGGAGPRADPTLVRPSAVVEGLSGTLRDAGFDLAAEVDPAADALPAPTLRTLTRAMQEGVTNILRYGQRGGCGLTLRVGDDEAVLRMSNEVPARRLSSRLSLGYGLTGLRERADLLGGTFAAGPEGDKWVVRLALPVER